MPQTREDTFASSMVVESRALAASRQSKRIHHASSRRYTLIEQAAGTGMSMGQISDVLAHLNWGSSSGVLCSPQHYSNVSMLSTPIANVPEPSFAFGGSTGPIQPIIRGWTMSSDGHRTRKRLSLGRPTHSPFVPSLLRLMTMCEKCRSRNLNAQKPVVTSAAATCRHQYAGCVRQSQRYLE